MVLIIFEAHATSLDNEANKASGHFDVGLSLTGKKQAKELGERYREPDFAAVFCSDLKRSHDTAKLAFGRKLKIIEDSRLRECDYGDWTRKPSDQLEKIKQFFIKKPFPNGESYEETTERMKSFLKDIRKKYDSKKIMIIGHLATQYGLEHLINNRSLKKTITDPWVWQPGWVYELKKI